MNGTHDTSVSPDRWSVAVGTAAFALCLALTPSFPGRGDAGEFTLALALRGVPHPTGYPLYVLLGHAWVVCLHALGMSWVQAANSWSAAGAGVACGLMHALAVRTTGPDSHASRSARALMAALPAVLLLGNRAFLREATVAEVGTWQLAAVLGLSLAVCGTLRALARPAEALTEGELRRRLFLTGLAAGAALSHHATSVCFVLPLVVAVVVARTRARRLGFVTTMHAWAGAAIPLLSWLHVAWRAWHPAVFQWPLLEPSWPSVLAHATGRVFGGYLGRFAPTPAEAALLASAVAPFAIPGLALAGWLAVRDRFTPRGLLLGALSAAAMLQLAFVFRYGVPDSVPYVLPPLAVALLAIGIVTARMAHRLASPVPAGTVLLLLLVHVLLGQQWTAALHREDARVAAAIRARWDALPFERGIVLWNSDHYTHLLILGVLEKRKPDILVDNPAMLTWEPARRAFERRTGLDPLAGLRLRDDSDLPLIAPNVARQGRVPVVDFATWSP